MRPFSQPCKPAVMEINTHVNRIKDIAERTQTLRGYL